MWCWKKIPLWLGIAATVFSLQAQTPTAKQAGGDVLIFTDGEKLIGHLERATGASVTFKSDMAGEVTVEWSKIQELRTADKFAAVTKGVKLRHSEDAKTVPQGTLAMTGQQLQVTGAPDASKTVAVSDVSAVVSEPDFEKAFERSSFMKGWKGGATAGISLTESTQKNQTFTAAINMVRAVPGVSWMDVRSRTILDFNEAYSKLTQPGSPDTKTSLYHAGVEEDWYLSSRIFAFGQAIFDHSFSQGLDLQQTYGGGIGVVVFKRPKKEFDIKASADYIDYQFENSTLNKRLFGSIFGETYVQTFAHGILLNEQAGITPAWTDTKAYSAFASAAITFPVYRHFGLTVGALDNFLNVPPPGFKKNSFQFTAGATYAF